MEIGLKILVNIPLILITIFFGFILHSTGKPYNQVIFTFHKLLSLGFTVFISIILFNFIKDTSLSASFMTYLILCALSVILLFVSGAMLSIDKAFDVMLLVHRISTIVFIICTTALFFYILKNT